MDELNKSPHFFDEEVRIIAYCPFCEADLNPVKAKIVDVKDDLNLIHMQCNKCRSYILALVMQTAVGLSSVGLITDLDFDDVSRFKDKQRLSSDEIIDIHHLFNRKNIIKEIIERR